jgi:ribose-phosphate pyrophosphokinase
MKTELAITTGSANPALAAGLAESLDSRLIPCRTERFPDGEIGVQLLAPVRDRTVVIVQSTSPPVNDHLVELLALVDACRRAAALQIKVIVPYFGYARADKRKGRREPITARMVADLLETVGVDHVLTLDPHTPQMEGFFHVPVDSLTAVPALCSALREGLPDQVAVVSPDAGRVAMATAYADRLKAPLIVLYKRRESGRETAVTHIVGDVKGRTCLIIDDMIATGGTIAESARALREAGASPELFIAATHGLFVEGARDKLLHSGARHIFVTDSVAQASSDGFPVQVVSVAPLLAAAVRQLTADGSISEAYQAERGLDHALRLRSGRCSRPR